MSMFEAVRHVAEAVSEVGEALEHAVDLDPKTNPLDDLAQAGESLEKAAMELVLPPRPGVDPYADVKQAALEIVMPKIDAQTVLESAVDVASNYVDPGPEEQKRTAERENMYAIKESPEVNELSDVNRLSVADFLESSKTWQDTQA